MGTETQSCIVIFSNYYVRIVKLNNPLMGTETLKKKWMSVVVIIWLN